MHGTPFADTLLRLSRGAAAAGLAVGLPMLAAGCAASEKANYAEHLETLVEPGATSSPEVIAAFDLDRPHVPDEAVATAGSGE